jgi:hypothetical protein
MRKDGAEGLCKERITKRCRQRSSVPSKSPTFILCLKEELYDLTLGLWKRALHLRKTIAAAPKSKM